MAGFEPDTLDPVNPHAQIGSVIIGGDCVASDIVAGTQNIASSDDNFGDSNDAPIPDNSTAATHAPLSSIAKITINGTVSGTDSATNSSDHFGFVAQQIGPTVHGKQIHLLTPGPSNDDIPLRNTGDFNVHEI